MVSLADVQMRPKQTPQAVTFNTMLRPATTEALATDA